MSWQDRVSDSIYFKSPSGQPFRALWTGGKRTKSKKLGIFEYPGARGAVVQDLDVSADSYPITFYFEGPDHDIYAAQFYEACNERGTWSVLHPKDGNLVLQLVTVTEDSQPVSAGNITTIESEWIEIGIDNPAASIAQLEDDVEGWADEVRDSALGQFEDKVKVDKPTLLAQIKASVATANAIVARATATRAAVIQAVNGAVIQVAAVASSVVTMVTLPGMALADTRARVVYFEKVITDAATITPTQASGAGVNTLAVQELVGSAALIGMAQTLAAASFTTRQEALNYLARMHTALMALTTNLDAAQVLYAGNPIDKQYFSQSGSFNDMLELSRRVRELLLRRSFDLAAAKRITLRRDRAPIEIALTEGVDLDSFIASNALKGDEILLLPTGRQVVVYL